MRRYLAASSRIVLAMMLVIAAGCQPKDRQSASRDGTREGVPSATSDKGTGSESSGVDSARSSSDPGTVGEGLTIAADKGAIAGFVRFEGSPPKLKSINFAAEKQCGDLHKTPPVYETVVVNGNGTLKWTLVSLKGRLPGEYEVPAEPVVIDQVGCVFVPHVVAVMEGQEVEFRNSDPVTHNVRANPKLGKPFNMIIPVKGAPQRERLAIRELGVPIKCDIHFWMSGYIHVVKHPFFAVTGGDGSFKINGIPPGTYKIEAWHETLDEQTLDVTVEAGKLTKVDFVFRK